MFRDAKKLLSWAKSWGFNSTIFHNVSGLEIEPSVFVRNADELAEFAMQSNKSIV